jgi:hypothetical protein
MKSKNIKTLLTVGTLCCGLVMGLTACSDMLETESELVEFEKDNTLNHPTDSVYSVLGIVNKMQMIADRTVLLGEVRADLMTTTEAATADLKRLANFDMAQDNKYNRVSDYYAVINNCNYYLAHIDTAMQRRGRNLFLPEFAAVKSLRAWTYLQLVQAYGQVPLVTEPLMTEPAAREAMNQPRKGITEICEYFINDLTPFADIDLPDLGTLDDSPIRNTLIPMRPLLGDLCLWAGRYEEAARWYHDYLSDEDRPVVMSNTNRVTWESASTFVTPRDAYTRSIVSYIPMEARVFDGTVSDLPNIMNSTTANNYYFQMQPSAGLKQISADQIYCIENKTETTTDTLYAPRDGFYNNLLKGDLRLYSNYHLTSLGGKSEFTEYNSEHQIISKLNSTRIATYSVPMLYLRYAEALNRAGYPQSAMVVLKYGMCEENMEAYVDSVERKQAAALTSFSNQLFLHDNALGIHSRGSGESQANAYYVLPQPKEALASRQDTVNYQIPLVEDMIVTEMALDGAFEGTRFYDLMRVALRRHDPAYLADPVSRRDGNQNAVLHALLMDTNNWYLPLK